VQNDPFPWDVNHDGVVNVNDLVAVTARFLWVGPAGSIPEDVNADGVVNVNDLVAVSNHFLQFRPGTPVPTPTPHTASTVNLDFQPASVKLNVGDTTTANVQLTTNQVTRGLQFGLSFDPSVVQVVSVDEGTFYSSWASANGASTTVFPAWAIHNPIGGVDAGGLFVLGGPSTGGPVGTGVAASVTLRAIHDGTSTLHLVNAAVSGLSSSGVPQDIQGATFGDGVIQVGAAGPTSTAAPTNAVTPVPTSPPTAAPSPATPAPMPTPSPAATLPPAPTPILTLISTSTPATTDGTLFMQLDPSPPAADGSVKIDVLMTLNPGLESRGMEFGLTFDSTIVHVTRVDLGPFYSDWATSHGGSATVFPHFAADNVRGVVQKGAIFLQTPAGSPFEFNGVSGTGTVAVLTVLGVAPGQTTLRLSGADVSVQQPGRTDPILGALTPTPLQMQIVGAGSTPTSMPTVAVPTFTPTPAAPVSTPTPSITAPAAVSGTPIVTFTPSTTPTPTGTASPPGTGTPTASVTASVTVGRSPTVPLPTATPTVPGVVSTVTSLSINPPTINLTPGATVTVSLDLSTDKTTRGSQFGLAFNPQIIQVQSVDEGTFYSNWASTHSGASTTVFPAWAIDNTAGTVSVGNVLITGGPPTGGPTGSGTFATITLKALGSGTSPLTLVNPDVSGLDQAGIPTSIQGLIVNNGQIVVGAQAGPSPSPSPGGSPTRGPTTIPSTETPTATATATGTAVPGDGALSFDQPSGTVTVSASATYTVNVKVALNSGVKSSGMQFALTYDATKINVTKVDVGSLYNDWANAHGFIATIPQRFTPDNTNGRTSVGAIALASNTVNNPNQHDGASGSGVAAVITFKAIATGTAALGFVTTPAEAPQVSFIQAGLADPGLAPLTPSTGQITISTATTPSPSITTTPTFTLTPTITLTPSVTPTLTMTPGSPPPTSDPSKQTPVAALTDTPTAGPISSSNTSLSISPATKNVQVGDSFTVDVAVSVDRLSRGAQFGLTFDQTVVEVDSVDEGTFYQDWAHANGKDTIIFPNWTPDNSSGTVSAGSVLVTSGGSASSSQDENSGAQGNGVVATISLKALANGTSTLTLTNAVVSGLDDRGGAKVIQGTAINGGQIIVGQTTGTPTVTVTGTTTPTTTAAQATATQAALTTSSIAASASGGVSPLSNSASTTSSGASTSAGVRPVTSSGGASSGTSANAATTASGGAQSTGGAQSAGGPSAVRPGAVPVPGAALPGASVTGQSDTSGVEAVTNPDGSVTVSGVQTAPGGASANSAAGRSGASQQSGPGGSSQGVAAGLIATIDLSSAIDDRGVVQREVLYSDPGGTFNLLIPVNTIALDKDHKPLREINVELLDNHPVVPDDRALLGQALEFSPSGASFNPPIRISLGYDSNDLPDGFSGSDLDLDYFDSNQAAWVTLNGSAEPATRSVSASTAHFTSFGVITRNPPATNWLLIAGILALELGVGVAGFVIVVRRRQLAAAQLPVDDALFARPPVADAVGDVPQLPPPLEQELPHTKVEDHAHET
jgi:hypothetical protein